MASRTGEERAGDLLSGRLVAATFPVAPTATSRANAEPRGSQILIASWLEFRRPPVALKGDAGGARQSGGHRIAARQRGHRLDRLRRSGETRILVVTIQPPDQAGVPLQVLPLLEGRPPPRPAGFA